MVYAVVSKTTGRKALRVRVPPPVQGTMLRLASHKTAPYYADKQKVPQPGIEWYLRNILTYSIDFSPLFC